MPALYKSRAWLENRYQRQHKSIKQIAAEAGTTEPTIWRWLDKFELLRKK